MKQVGLKNDETVMETTSVDSQSTKNRFALWPRLVEVVALLAFLAPLILYAWVGLYTRYAADDYETAGALQKYGFWGSLLYWRASWSGRYAYFLIANAFHLVGVRAAPALAVLFICLWLLSLSWLLSQLLRMGGQPRPGYLAVLGSVVILVVTLRSMDHIHQILFWFTGILTYVNYLVFLLLGAAWFVYRVRQPFPWRRRWWEVVLFGIYAFFAAGLAELTTILQLVICFLGCLILYFIRPNLRRDCTLVLCCAALVFTLLGFGVMLSAPGNALRALTEPPRPGLVSLVYRANANTLLFIASWVWRDTILAGVAFLTPLLAGFAYKKPTVNRGQNHIQEQRAFHILLGSLPVLYVLLLSQFAASYYTLSTMPPDRALVISQFLMVTLCALWGYLTGGLLRSLEGPGRRLPRGLYLVGAVLLVLALACGPGYASTRIYTMIAPARLRALEWDERDRIIHQAIAQGERDIVVWYIQDFTRLGDYNPDPNFSVNRAAAAYYGINSITALSERP